MVNIYEMLYLMINDPLPVWQAMSKILVIKIQSTLTCFTKCAKCMTLSVSETSITMQRSHGILASDIFA